MRTEFPFAFQVSLMSPRWKHAREIVQIGFVDAVLPVVMKEDAPVAMSWTCSPGRQRQDTPAVESHVRLYNEAFYVPLARLPSSSGRIRDEAPISDMPSRSLRIPVNLAQSLMNLFPFSQNDPRMEAISDWYATNRHLTGMEDRDDLQVVFSSEEENRLIAEAIVSRFIVVQGEVYIRVEEPKLCLKIWDLPFREASLSVQFDPPFYEDMSANLFSPSYTRLYRATDIDIANTEIASLAARPCTRNVGDVEVFDETRMTFDRAHDISVRAACNTLAMVGALLPDAGRQCADAWYDLDDALKAYKSDGDKLALENAVVDSLGAMAESLAVQSPNIAMDLALQVELILSCEIAPALEQSERLSVDNETRQEYRP